MSPSQTNGTVPVLEPKQFGPDIKVAVIGAGVSGITTAAHFLRNGIDVTVFERSGLSSGVWHYDPKVPNSPSYPSVAPSVGDYASKPGQFSPAKSSSTSQNGNGIHPPKAIDEDALRVAFSPPGPCYAGLRNNVPTSLLYSSLGPWPEGTEDITGHAQIESYLQGLSAEHGVDDVTVFHTRVEDARKSEDGSQWILQTVTLLKGDGSPRFLERTWKFDALVVASGHYNLPRIPDTPGLAAWKSRFGDRIIHTKEYRHPETYRDKTVLVIGGGASAMDVCRESTVVAKRVLQSTRGGEFDVPKSMLPPSIEQFGAIESFEIDAEAPKSDELDPAAPISGRVVLKDGQVLKDIDYVVLATGYLTSYPFLPQYHSDSTDIDAATPDILVTSEGNMVHHLHKDIFYIEDPSLAFIGVPYYTATFALFDFQAQALAWVYAGKTRLPSRESMREEYEKRVATIGRGRGFHSLAEDGAEPGYIKDLFAWANASVVDSKLEPLKGHSEKWLKTYWEAREQRKKLKESTSDHPEANWP
ncbi:hypothetical protein AK830_g4428 [Neonectria ditissima]|uniref:FAD dependent oxidoreductase domain-containing protein n=1 Tax=Neonectria ditissima TaxID=78410 RepID=A0A0P7AW03_9HYPO|nr:hypothetical protein AK830_g4428 [Neonectria ditissima]